MVDAIVSFVLTRVGDHLMREALFLGGVRNEVVSLKNELGWMKCFIKDAEEKQIDNPMIRKWVSDITEIAYDTEDVLDKFFLDFENGGTSNVLKVVQGSTSKKSSRFFTDIKKHSCSCIFEKEAGLTNKGKETVKLYNIGKEIEALRKRLRNLSLNRQEYGLQNINDMEGKRKRKDLEKLKQLRRASSFAVEENVGFEDDANKLLAKLFEKEPKRSVISIFGMGGLGKTTLARRLYHDVKGKFHRCAWVSVSQDYNTHDLLIRIIRSFGFDIDTKELKKMNEEDLERFLNKSLQACSYLVVVDDVWEIQAWESLKRAFPEKMNGSRVIITTRIREVAECWNDRTHFHELRFLRPDESWKLFCHKVFRDLKADEQLEKLGKEMVEKCGGLPLAIVVLAGLLSTKNPEEWDVVRNHIWRHLRKQSVHITYLLDLSFNDLPYQLKLCFLYLGLFPEDFEINVEELIRLYVAEGFIPQEEDQTMEDVARDNLDDLINRSLIQIDKRYWGRIATCRVHDLLRDLAIQKAKELNFVHIYDDQIKQSTSSNSFMASCRRQAVYSWTENSSWLQHGNPLLRSFFFLDQQRSDFFGKGDVLTRFYRRFSLLRVLNFDCCGSWIPKEIGKFIHLKYLGLNESLMTEFPPSIVNLRNLQTLYIYVVNWFSELPNDIFKLKELRHLIGRFRGALLIDNLTNLQTLKHVEYYKSWTNVNTEKLVNLRELHIDSRSRSRTKEKEFTFVSIAKLKSLQILSVLKDFSFASLEPLRDCQNLKDLRLQGNIEKLPGDMEALLPNLQCLRLRFNGIEEDPMPALGKLPKLKILDLYLGFNHVVKLIRTARGFRRLEILELGFRNVVEWQVEEGAFPMLKGLSLNLGNLSNFRIPERLRLVPLPGNWNCKDSENLWFI